MAQELVPAGRLAVAYYNTDGALIDDTTNLPKVWLELAATIVAGNVTDVSFGTSPTYANTNTRARTAKGFMSRKPVIRDAEITFEILHRTEAAIDNPNSFEQKLLDRADDLAPMAISFYDYAAKAADLATGELAYGLVGNWYVAAEKTEAIEDVQRWAITLTQESEAQYIQITGA